MITAGLAFLLTVALEWVVLALYSKLGFARTGWFCLCMNAATWGALNGVFVLFPVPIVILELVVIVAEAVLLCWFWGWRPARGFVGSLLMNLVSWLIGGSILAAVAPRL